MLVDFQNEADVGPLEADLVIVGTGPAGLSLALQFLNSNKKVILLEGGRLELSDESQEIYEGQIVGTEYIPLEESRLRYFGGTSGHWGGWCGPLDRRDFEKRPYVPHSGWPIGIDDLKRYFEAAHEILDLGAPNYDPKALPFPQQNIPDLDAQKIVLKPWRFSPPTRFNEKYMQSFATSDNATVLYNANATNLILSAEVNRALSIEVRDYGDKHRVVSADYFVLAMGGTETPRFLLNCRDQIDAGIGNAYDNVGRFWMDHPELVSGEILAGERSHLLQSLIKRFADQGVEIRNGLCVSDAYRDRHEILNHTVSVSSERLWHRARGMQALYRIARDIRRGKLSRIDNHIGLLLSDLDGATTGVAGKLGLIKPPDTVRTFSRLEPSPNPNSRVYLVDEKDRFGHNRIALDWRLTELDHRTVRVAQQGLSEELGRLGIGRLKLPDWLRQENAGTWGNDLKGARHHMGGTRMSDDPKTGVVDKNCKVHGIDNLYIAGSGVFPTCGYMNPTLTIVQLALRLADHLESRIDHVTN